MQQINEKLIRFWINKINDFVKSQKINIEPLPSIHFIDDKNDVSDILISTGGYQPMSQSIFLYVDNRHLKDILRSYVHELVHHIQWLDNPDYIRRIFTINQDDIADNSELEEIEAEAYLKGNLLFRKFTEWFKRQQIAKNKKNV